MHLNNAAKINIMCNKLITQYFILPKTEKYFCGNILMHIGSKSSKTLHNNVFPQGYGFIKVKLTGEKP